MTATQILLCALTWSDPPISLWSGKDSCGHRMHNTPSSMGPDGSEYRLRFTGAN
jgi:hypothetical protein